MTYVRRHVPYLVTVAVVSLVAVAWFFVERQVVEIRYDCGDVRYRAGPVTFRYDRQAVDVREAYLWVTQRDPKFPPEWLRIGTPADRHHDVLLYYSRPALRAWFDVSPAMARRILSDLEEAVAQGRWARREDMGVEGLLSHSAALEPGLNRSFVRPGWLRSRVLADYCTWRGLDVGAVEPTPAPVSDGEPCVGLLRAAREGRASALAAAADLQRGCGPGWLLLHEAVAAGQVDEARWLLENGADPNGLDGLHWVALHWAAAQGRADIAHVLLDHGATTDPMNMGGYTPLHLAADRGHAEVVRILLDAGASVKARCGTGWTPVFLAAGCGSTRAIRELIDAGARADVRDDQGWTPLHWAALRSQRRAIALLLDSGADVNAQGADGTTPMHIAAGLDDADSIMLLLQYGADPEIPDRWGGTARERAAFRPDGQIWALLRDAEPPSADARE
jgi:ankyrin repeat protein